jgi:hypothetical protein
MRLRTEADTAERATALFRGSVTRSTTELQSCGKARANLPDFS